jgi:predicted ATP-grasp superfamily ATP-dependent carboligase
VALFSDKQKTIRWLADHDLPVPRGCLLRSASDVPAAQEFPAMIKPNDGAGSLGVQIVSGLDEINSLDWSPGQTYRLETFCPGQPASVAMILGGESPRVLAPCRQLFHHGSFDYRGGCVLADDGPAARAIRLGKRIARELPDERGYLGVDLILGDDPDGWGDRVLEINPRLTTSYVGLRASTDTNLAEVILHPDHVFDLRFSGRPLEFRSDGTIRNSTHKVNMACDG